VQTAWTEYEAWEQDKEELAKVKTRFDQAYAKLP
jgi:hypothetical protein